MLVLLLPSASAAWRGTTAIPMLPAPAEVVRCGAPDVPRMAITIDDGPTSAYTPRVLRVLRQQGVKATFFVLGRLALRYPELLRQMVAEGHMVANHSWNHPKTGTVDSWKQQIQRTETAILAAGVLPQRVFRPPHGKVTPAVLQACSELGYTIVLYTVLSSDWKLPGARALRAEVVTETAPGGVVVMHDGGGPRDDTVQALPGIVVGLRARGLEPVRLDQLLAAGRSRARGCAVPRTALKGQGSARSRLAP